MIPLVPPVAVAPASAPPGRVMLNTQEPLHPLALPLACTLTKSRSTPLASWNDVTGEHTAVELGVLEPVSVANIATTELPPAGLGSRYTIPFTQLYRFPDPPVR